MKKNRIRLTESQLHRVIKESVKGVLSEKYGTPNKETSKNVEELRYGPEFDKEPTKYNENDNMASIMLNAMYSLEYLRGISETKTNNRFVQLIRKHLNAVLNLSRMLTDRKIMSQGENPDYPDNEYVGGEWYH